MALNPSAPIRGHPITLPRHLSNPLLLAGGVGLLSAAIGTGAAGGDVALSGKRWREWTLPPPLAIPAYVGAHALVDFLGYAGPVQTGPRALMGWETARNHAFPEFGSRGAAVLVLTASLSAYVDLMARAGFRERSGAPFEVARSTCR